MQFLKEKAYISVVVYAHEAAASIADSLRQLDAVFAATFESYEIIVVDDASRDATAAEVTTVATELHGPITLVSMPWQHREGLGLLAGADLAVGDFIFEFEKTIIDYPVELIQQAYKQLVSGFDMVSATPNQSRRVSRWFYRMFKRFSPLGLDLKTESFRVITRRLYNSISKSKEKIRYGKVLYRYAGYPYTTINYTATRLTPDSSSLPEKISLAVEILLTFSNLGPNLSIIVSLVFLGVSLLLGVYAAVVWLTFQSVISGWTTLMLFLSFSFSGIFFVLGLIGKYLAIILLEVKERPPYMVQAIKRLK